MEESGESTDGVTWTRSVSDCTNLFQEMKVSCKVLKIILWGDEAHGFEISRRALFGRVDEFGCTAWIVAQNAFGDAFTRGERETVGTHA